MTVICVLYLSSVREASSGASLFLTLFGGGLLKKEWIKLAGMTILTVLMVLAVTLTFPVKSVYQHKNHEWVLISRIYMHRADTDCVWLSSGEVTDLKDVKKADQDKICGRVLLSSMEGFK